MPTLREVADEVSRDRAPLLCLDTCSLLDVVRAPVRDNLGASAVAASLKTIDAATQVPRRLVLAVSPFVPAEHAAGLPKPTKEAEDTLKKWFGAISKVSDVLALLDIRPVEVPSVDEVIEKLLRIAANLYQACRVIDPDAAAQDRALTRLRSGTRPCHEFRVSDALHLEHYLALARLVRAADPHRRCVFVSGNTSDFAESEKSTRLHPALVGDFAIAGLEYFASLNAALGSLLRETNPGPTG